MNALDPSHEALSGLGIDAKTHRDWNAGYCRGGVNHGRLALPITGDDGTVVAYLDYALHGELPTLAFPGGLIPEAYIFGSGRVTAGQLGLCRDPISTLKGFAAGYENPVSFLTREISALQLEHLARFMRERSGGTLVLV
jgi:hypothetical protein